MPSREQAVERLGDMLRALIRRAKEDGHKLAPFIGIDCPIRPKPHVLESWKCRRAKMNTEQKPDRDKGDTISLRLDPAIARELRAEAERRGFSLEALVVEMWSLYRSRVD
jgi:hypothetical protein